MMGWDHWQTLLAVFRVGSYAKAAHSLQLDATTVGRRLKQMERQLGYSLFLRHKGKLHPTHQCESLLVHLETASEALRSAEQNSATSEGGAVWRSLRLTAPPFLIKNMLAPEIATLSRRHRIRIELMGTASNISLTRREADIAIRIDDRPPSIKLESEQIEAERIGTLAYSVYCSADAGLETLPWAGLMEDHPRTTGSAAMNELAQSEGFRFRVYHFDALIEIIATGVARAMLPCFVAYGDKRLRQVDGVVLRQPLWMLYHRQDDGVDHLDTARDWIRTVASRDLTVQ